MLMKPHIEPVELKLLSYLIKRKNLSSKEKLHYLNLEKGYEGESKVAAWLENLTSEWIILYGLLLENNGSLFQIDTLLISQNTIYLFEVKIMKVISLSTQTIGTQNPETKLKIHYFS